MEIILALEKLKKYCAYKERCHSEVRNKLLELKVYGHDLESIIAELITENFLSEERYAKAYVSGKFVINKWGRNKIIQGLRAKKISPYSINKSIGQILEEDYLDTLEKLIRKKAEILHPLSGLSLYKKIVAYGMQKGYEYHLISEVYNSLDN